MSYIKFKLDGTTYKSKFDGTNKFGDEDGRELGAEIGHALMSLSQIISSDVLVVLASAVDVINTWRSDDWYSADDTGYQSNYQKAAESMRDAARDLLSTLEEEEEEEGSDDEEDE